MKGPPYNQRPDGLPPRHARKGSAPLKPRSHQVSRNTSTPEERELDRLLHGLSDASMPKDFTRRVLAALEDPSSRPQPTLWAWTETLQAWTHSLQPRTPYPRAVLAAAVAAITLLAVLWIRHDQPRERPLASSVAAITRPVREVAQAAQLPPVELFQDFEAIDQMRRLSTLADEELLASLATPAP